MKTKLSILILEISDTTKSGVSSLKILVDNEQSVIGKYVSTKSRDDTIVEILSKYTNNLDTRYCTPVLTDFFHEAGSNECEVVYVIAMPEFLISPTKYSQLLSLEVANIEEKYGRSIELTPRSI